MIYYNLSNKKSQFFNFICNSDYKCNVCSSMVEKILLIYLCALTNYYQKEKRTVVLWFKPIYTRFKPDCSISDLFSSTTN